MAKPISRSGKQALIACCALLTSLLLYSCSSLQFAYNRLDWLLAEQIDDYISFSDNQEALLEKHLEQLLRWHRHSQLPIYAQWLRRVQNHLSEGLQPEDLDAYETELRAMYGALLQQLTPPAAELLATLSDDQVEELLTALDKRNRKYQTKRADLPPAKWRNKRAEQMLEHSERWLGDTTPQQGERIEQWAAELELSAPETLVYRQRWRDAFGKLLQERQQPDFGHRLYDLAARPEILQSDTLRRMRRHNLQLFKQLLLDLYVLSNTEQRHYLGHRLQTLSNDFDELAAQ